MFLRERGKTAQLEELSESQLAPGNIAYVRQQQPAGLGHAVWCARHIVGDEPFAVLLPDELLYEPANPCLKQMVEAYNEVGGTVIAVMEVPEEHTDRYGIVAPGATQGALTEVKGFVEKPKAGTAPSRLAAIGRYIIQPEVMEILSSHKRGAGGEVQLTDAMAELIGRQPFHAFTYAGRRFDCGDKAGHIIANVAVALDRPDIAPAVRAYIATL
jgi:UTP--glucose-1-phosphate uridylyltransferase